MGAFKEPHGGQLKELYLTEGEAEVEQLRAGDYASWDLTPRQLCDLDLLTNGCLLYTSPSPRDRQKSRMPSSA